MATPATAEARAKAGLWTKHVDVATGRKYYFNMVQNRSFWELPEELLAEVQTPGIDKLREWDPEAAARYEQPAQAATEEELIQRRRRELVAAAMAADTSGPTAMADTLQERMALAAQRRAEEMKQNAPQHQQKQKEGGDGNDSNAYLKMVRELQAKDRDTEGSGGKWLVR